MVTCQVVDAQQSLQSAAVTKMNSVRTRKPSSSNSSGLRLLDGDHLENNTSSSVSRNSIYKLKIDLMFDEARSMRSSNQLDDLRGSQRTRSIIMYGRSELASTVGESATKSIASLLHESSTTTTTSNGGAGSGGLAAISNGVGPTAGGGGGVGGSGGGGVGAGSRHLLLDSTKNDVQRISNSVQAQIEQLFTDVAKDATSSFAVTCLGALPLKDKVTSLQGLQEPLRELYIKKVASEVSNAGVLDICASGLRVKHHKDAGAGDGVGVGTIAANDCENESNITPFHHIAVWSAVKFVVSEDDGGAAFLPLITDPENIDKASLFHPLSVLEQRHLMNNTHAPIFAVVMRSPNMPKVLECHGFICKSAEDAIVIAATLYQSLMAHVSSSSHRSTKRRTPRNQNGVSCISIASSSAQTGSQYLSHSQCLSGLAAGRKSSLRSSTSSHVGSSTRSTRKKRIGTGSSSFSSSVNVINEAAETTTEERKRKSHKTKRAPPVPLPMPPTMASSLAAGLAYKQGLSGGGAGGSLGCSSSTYLEALARQHGGSLYNGKGSHRGHHHPKTLSAAKSTDSLYRAAELYAGGGGALGGGVVGGAAAIGATSAGGGPIRGESTGDILTRVAIPRSGSFLNTGGLTRYKSRAARRHSGKLGGGGGGGSPLGFSELFNEFRLHENLHSLDDILSVIIDADGMSFNDLKPIYKEFLLKLALTLTKDELFQRSKNIMRRQKKKKKLKRKPTPTTSSQKPSRGLQFGTKSLKKVFQLGQFRSCRGKPAKPARNKEAENKRKSTASITISLPIINAPHLGHQQHQHQRSRVATSGSDVSVVRQDNHFAGLNRNSSSGYVSCSECSYDSETCTCASADRCYCSLRTDQTSNKIQRDSERNKTTNGQVLAKHSPSHRRKENSSTRPPNRDSLVSCKSDDKCYCSMVEEEDGPPIVNGNGRDVSADESLHTHSDTTWCDSDSCASVSKCYCKRSERRRRTSSTANNGGKTQSHNHHQQQHQHHRTTTTTTTTTTAMTRCSSGGHKPPNADKLAFDYELFTVNGSGKPVQPHEALSVKKSVEAAAVFADVKLSQTTDIKSLCTADANSPNVLGGGANNMGNGNKSSKLNNGRNQGSIRSHVSTTTHKYHDSCSIDRKNEQGSSGGGGGAQKSCSADDLLSKLSAIEKSLAKGASVKSVTSTKSRSGGLRNPNGRDTLRSNYQSMRAVSASLEDTLGYLP